MTDEQETNHAFARSRSNAGLGVDTPWPDDCFVSCPTCAASGSENIQPLYANLGTLECPIHGLFTDKVCIAEWKKIGAMFLLGRCPK